MNISNFCKNKTGNMAIVIVLSVIPLLGLLGLGIETNMLTRQRQIAQSSADTAILTVGKTLLDEKKSVADLQSLDPDPYQTLANDAFKINASNTECEDGTLQFMPPESNAPITFTVKCSYDTAIMRILGKNNVDYSVIASSKFGDVDSIDILFVLDMSESMLDYSRILYLKEAMNDIVDYIATDMKTEMELDQVRLGIVPFGTGVSLGTLPQIADNDKKTYSIKAECLDPLPEELPKEIDIPIDLPTPKYDSQGKAKCKEWEEFKITWEPNDDLSIYSYGSGIEIFHLTKIGPEDEFAGDVQNLTDYIENSLNPYYGSTYGGTSSFVAMYVANHLFQGKWDDWLATEHKSQNTDGNNLKVIVFMSDGAMGWFYFDTNKYSEKVCSYDIYILYEDSDSLIQECSKEEACLSLKLLENCSEKDMKDAKEDGVEGETYYYHPSKEEAKRVFNEQCNSFKKAILSDEAILSDDNDPNHIIISVFYGDRITEPLSTCSSPTIEDSSTPIEFAFSGSDNDFVDTFNNIFRETVKEYLELK